jgi:hypothetical protein
VLDRDGSRIPAEINLIVSFAHTLIRWQRDFPFDQTMGLETPSYESITRTAESLHNFCAALDLSGAEAAFTRLRIALGSRRVTYRPDGWVHLNRAAVQEIAQLCTDVAMRTLDELKGRAVFWVPRRGMAFVAQDQPLFGQAVADAFPSASLDIAEAGMCLGFGRWTACVMHLQRASEVGLKTLAKTVGIGQQSDWGAYIRLIEKALDTRAKAAGKRSPDEEFYSETSAVFDRLRRAWRNPTMHPDRSYAEEQAGDIYAATKSLLQQLSRRIRE